MKLKTETKNTTEKLTQEEKDLLKKEIEGVWGEFPLEMKKYIFETKKQKLQVLYMIQDWAKNNNRPVITDLVSKRICHKEAKIEKMKQEIGE